MKNVFGVVVLYHPTEGDSIKNISSYLHFVDKIIIADNSEATASTDFSCFGSKAILIADNDNKGIAFRLNQAAQIAIEAGASWLLTMDQDSSFTSSNLQLYERCFEKLEDTKEIAMIGVEHSRQEALADCSFVFTSELITSGSLINLAVFSALGGFDENLFIDEVDTEYCFRALIKGYKTIKFPHVVLQHSLGELQDHYSLKTLKKTARILHSPIRLYYMVRNHLYINKKYGQQIPEELKKRRKAVLNMVKNNLLYGKNKLKLIHLLILGYCDYRRPRMGKFDAK